ncbi:MAG: winged helix-turn-helix transcriptional regulator [Ruminococcaceae bacterium]|nr:winged helix-turn-helix transcriptional regulator [Oscillospiraceae bacterium]
MSSFNLSEAFKALSDENRVTVLRTLMDGELCAAEILQKLNITQPTLSHHMKTLCESGLVKSRKQGKWTYYSVNDKAANKILKFIKDVFSIELLEVTNETAAKSTAAPKKDLPSHLL